MKAGYILVAALLLIVSHAFAQKSELRKGLKHYKAYEYAEAVKYFQTSVAIDTTEDAVYYLATCYRHLNSYREAERWYSVLVSKPNWVQSVDHLYYGHILKNLEKYDAALAQFEQFAKKRPEDARGKKMIESCKYAMQLKNSEAILWGDRMSNINSNKDDFSPMKYNKGVVFGSSREGSAGMKNNKRSGQPHADLYYADKFQEKTLGVPKPFAAELNTMADEAASAYDATRKVLYFTRGVMVKTNPDLNSEGIYKLKIYQTEFVEGAWKKPVALHFNSNSYNTAHPTLSKDGKKMYFCSDMAGGYGGKDIYVTYWNDEGWSMPQNLGDVINTMGDESFPFVHDNGDLYFSSDFHPGMGGLDVLMATRKEKGKDVFTRVQNMGKAINSSVDDFGMLMTTDTTGYMASNRIGGNGGDDIYYVFKLGPEGQNPPDYKNPDEKKYIMVSGKVVEKLMTLTDNSWEKTRGAIVDQARVVLMQNNRQLGEKMTSADGRFTFEVPEAGDFVIMTSKIGYLHGNQVIVSKTDVMNSKEVTVELEKIIITDLLFDFDRSTINGKAKTKLDLLQQLLVERPDLKIEISGHTCPLGADEYNYTLSEQRARSVYSYLTKSKQVDGGRLATSWFGETRLKTDKYAEYHLNRRAELRVIHQGQVNTAQDGFYIVKKGDNLFRIAKNNNTTVQELRRINNMKDDSIKVGQRLQLR